MFNASARPMPSVMSHSFSQVPKAEIPRSSFNRSHGHKTTFDAGDLVPVFVDLAVPGDTYNCKMTAFVRMATPLYPIMDNLYLDAFFFAVPIRLVWTNFVKMMGEQTDPGDSIDYSVPTMVAPVSVGHAVGSLSDYMGIPTGIAELSHSSLWHRAYNLIYNEWFRDENLIDSVVVDKDDGPDDTADYALKKRGKRHDYFTSCLPWTQKGSAVTIPLGTSAPAYVNSVTDEATQTANYGSISMAMNSHATRDPGDLFAATGLAGSGNVSVRLEGETDLSSATAATINALRLAFQTQKLLERDARGGTRYTEIVRSHFGVTSPDQRLQRPELLGLGSTRINFDPVPQTSESGTTDLGTLGSTAQGVIQNGFTKSFTEHCLLIGIVSARADLTYQQGLNRMFSYSTRYDFYWPALAHIGEQSVLNKEIYAQNDANDDLVFGYQERYAEMRYKPSIITGQYRSTYTTPLDAWHLAQEFSALPTLGQTFIEETPPMSRVLATDGVDFLGDFYFDLKCARPMPTYSVPGFIDHF